MVVVFQNLFSAEIDNPCFYKVFQLAPRGWWFCKEILVGGGIPHNQHRLFANSPAMLRQWGGGAGGGGNKRLVHNNRCC